MNLTKLKGRIRNTILYLTKTRRTYKLIPGISSAVVNVDKHFSDDDLGRYTLIICQYFKLAGFRIVVKTDNRFFQRVNKYKRVLLNQRYAFTRNATTPTNSIVLYHGQDDPKIINLKYGYNLANSKNHVCVVPYPLHPDMYHAYPSIDQLESLRNTPRAMRIFFSGNADVNLYSRDQLQERFNIMNRISIIKSVNEKFNDTGKLVLLERKEQLQQLLKDNHDYPKIFINADKTESQDWLKVLSKSDFFICAPGVRMPWAHNLTESMAVGTIPILQYAKWCSPPLTDGENCLAFTGAEDLSKVIDDALNMPQHEIKRIRKNVITYYEDYLSPGSVVKRIDEFMKSEKAEMTVAVPFVPSY